tara:strand:- start:706 stop:951 length:246 start_codon:yes stop_codon:yes gene_type:complete
MTVMAMLLIGSLAMIKRLQDAIINIEKEQHIQNTDIINLIKFRSESVNMLIQHADIIQYLADQDKVLSKSKVKYTGIVGEA